MTARRRRRAGLLLGALILAACSSEADPAAAPTTTMVTESAPGTTMAGTAGTPAPSTTAASPPDDPVRSAVEIGSVSIEPIGAAGTGVAQSGGAVVAGYDETEHLVSGSAATYAGPPTGPVEVVDTGQPYVTRILVRQPADPAAFSGRVVVEPFNTSSGSDLAAAYGMIGSLIPDQGDVWIGVSVRWISMTSLQDSDPERYEPIAIASNGLAWDILAQLGGVLKEGGEPSPLGDLAVDRLYMAGYSQNGIDTATFASAFGTRARMTDGSPIYDGYLPLAHSGSMTPIDSGATPLPAFEFVPFGATDVPVIDVESEADVLGFADPAYTNPGHAFVRRGDSDEPDDLYRLWEVTGAAHVKGPLGCTHEGTTFPLEFFVRAAYRRLTEWAEDGAAPPRADRIEMATIDAVSVAERDEYGNALGGVRSPFVDVPIAAYQGGDTGSPICGLAGIETPFDAETLAALYEDTDDYLDQFRAALADTIDDGFLLPEDEDAIIAYAEERAAAAFG